MRVLGSLGVVALGVSVLGCGDGPICPSEIVIQLSVPNGAVFSAAADRNPELAGTQVDIGIRSNLRAGDLVTLAVEGENETLVNYDGLVGEDGNFSFEDITIPEGSVTLSVSGTTGKGCGAGRETIDVVNRNDSGCTLALVTEPVTTPNYPYPVFNAEVDGSPAPGFQTQVDLRGQPGTIASLRLLDLATGRETSSRGVELDTDGNASFDITLGEGTRAVRGICTQADGASLFSEIVTVLIDTTPPTGCTLETPTTFVTADDDEDGDLTNGVQVTLSGAFAAGSDIDNSSAMFNVGDTKIAGTLEGDSKAIGAAVFGSPGNFDVGFTIADLAGNTCESTNAVSVDLDGCGITHVSPDALAFVTDDSSPASGFQTEIKAAADPACTGKEVTTTCGGGATGVVGPAGEILLEITLSKSDLAEGEENCRTEITADSGLTTFANANFLYDNLPPPLSLLLSPEPISCGGTVTASKDANGDLSDGVQIDAQIIAPLANELSLQVNGNTPEPLISNQISRVTLVNGANTLLARGSDEAGNEGVFSCDLTLADIEVGFSGSVADGTVGKADDNDGDVSAGVTIDLTGTVSDATASVTVAIDGGAPAPAIVSGGTWTLSNVTLTEGPHTVVATAVSGSSTGTATILLDVDTTPGPMPTNLEVIALTRQSVRIRFTVPDEADSYVARYANEPIDETNFDTLGTVIALPNPSTPGSTEDTVISQIRAGDLFFAVAAVDENGNRSEIASEGVIPVHFDQTGALLPPNSGDGTGKAFGFRVIKGNFNDDGFEDLAVSAPTTTNPGGVTGGGAVHVYFGSIDGISDIPDVTIAGTLSNSMFGQSLTRIFWSDDKIDDLVVGAPFDNGINGRVYIFEGGPGFNPSSFADADVVIETHPSNPGFFFFSGLGWNLTTATFNEDDSREDLVIAAVGAGGGVGGIVIVYGGKTDETTIQLSDIEPAGANAAAVHLLKNPDPGFTFRNFGETLSNVGPTQGPSDTRDDIAIAHANDDSRVGMPEELYILRDRSSSPPPGVHEITLGTNDLTIVDSNVDRTTGFGSRVASTLDQNGDAARDLLISSYRSGVNAGNVYLVSGAETGTINLNDSGFQISNFVGQDSSLFGVEILNSTGQEPFDVDNDGIEDIVIAGGTGDDTKLYVWHGGSVPTGTVAASDAPYKIDSPPEFVNAVTVNTRASIVATPVDINADGLVDICWADHGAESLEGRIEVIWDAPND